MEVNLMCQSILSEAGEIFIRLDELSEQQRIDMINKIKLLLKEHSPMKNEPVDCVLWIESNDVYANDYNPNNVAPPEMRLLKHSIKEDGYTQPIVTCKDKSCQYEVVDGFHRTRVGKESKEVKARLKGRLPITVINPERENKSDRIAATIRHNRARGRHMVDAMSDIVLDLSRRNWSDKKISKELGMEPDEVLRLKQITGLAELFADHEFSEAWEVEQND